MDLIVREITTNNDLKILSEEFSKFVGLKLEISYLSNGNSFLFLEKNSQKLLGGYAIIVKPPFRFISLLPKNIIKDNDFFKKNEDTHFFEVNAFFVKEKRWLKLILIEMLRYIKDNINKDYLLIFFDANNKKISRLWQKNLSLNEVYIGFPSSDVIKTSHKLVYFGYVEKKSIEDFLEILL